MPASSGRGKFGVRSIYYQVDNGSSTSGPKGQECCIEAVTEPGVLLKHYLRHSKMFLPAPTIYRKYSDFGKLRFWRPYLSRLK